MPVKRVHTVGSNANESLRLLNTLLGCDEMVEGSKALSSSEAMGAVPGSNQHTVHSIYCMQACLWFNLLDNETEL